MSWTGFVRKTMVEVVNVFWHINVMCTNPTELFIGIFVTEPLDKVPEFHLVMPVELSMICLISKFSSPLMISTAAGGGSS
jgi:hypothetical protein